MAVAFRAVGTVAVAASGNVAPALPTGHVSNDVLVLVVAAADNIVCSVAGYTSILAVNSSTTARLEVWAKRDGGAESAPTVTHTAGSEINAEIHAFSGVDAGLTVGTGAGSVFRDAQSQVGAGTSTTWTVTAPALTGVVSGDMLIFVGCYTVIADTSGTGAWSPVTSFTERLDSTDVANANAVSTGVDTLLATGAAGSITSTATWNGGAPTPRWVGAQLALSSDSSSTAVTPQPHLIYLRVNR